MIKVNKKILHTVLEQTAQQFSEHTAVEHGNRLISYKMLHDAADRLAAGLQAGGAGPDTIVGIYLENGVEFIVAVLGVMKAGAIFMPLDVSFPLQRIEIILGKTAPKFMLAGSDTKSRLDSTIEDLKAVSASWQTGCILPDLTVDWTSSVSDVFVSGDTPQCLSQPDDSNYIFFTSGSTGDPKAIVGCQKSLSHFIHWEAGEFDFNAFTRVSQLAPVSFDACLKDIFTPLLKGGTVCVPEKDVRNNISLLLDWIDSQKLTVVHCVPSLLRALLTEIESRSLPPEFLSHLKHVILAGEPVFGKDVKRWMDLFGDRIELVNLYGPTEATLIKTCHRIKTPPPTPGAMVHVGRPISNTGVLIVKANRLCDIGEIGDIYIKTPFLTKGYYNDPEKTRACFVQNPIQADSKEIVYRTGDLGRYLPDRCIEFVGRLDNQVKINGVRMELSEIEQPLAGFSALDQAVVQVQHNVENEKVLVCYYVEKEPVDAGKIRDYLGNLLPAYMLPSHYVKMAELPLNLNGKINRKALPRPEELLYADVAIVEAANDVERRLAAIWQDVLGVKQVSVETPFFEIGGHSLKAIQIVSQIYKVFKIEIRLKDFFEHPTIRDQARILNGPASSDTPPIDSAPVQPHYDLSHAQQRLWILSQMDREGTAYSMPGVYLIKGPLQKKIVEKAFDILIARHESLRTTFPVIDGKPRQQVNPVSLGGFRIHEIHITADESDVLPRTDSQPSKQVASHVEAEVRKPFDTAVGNLVRMTLIKTGQDRHVLVFNMHHIISDGWSVDVIARELFHLYAAFCEDKSPSLPELRIQYKDFTVWQNRFLASKSVQKHAEYWHTKLSGRLPVLDLPLDHPRPSVPGYQGRTQYFEWDQQVSNRFVAFSRKEKASLFMICLTGVKVLLHRYTEQTDGIVGTPMAGRDHPDLENQVGFYVNTLALRDEVWPEDSFREVLGKVKQTVLEAYEHQAYPFDRLVDELDSAWDSGRAPVFDVMVVFQENDKPQMEMGDVTISEMAVETGTAKFDLTFIFKETEGVLKIGINYNTDLFKPDTIVRMAGHLKNIFQHGVAEPDAAVADIELLEPDEVRQLSIDFNGVSRPYPVDRSLVDLFNAGAEQFQDRTAVIFEDRTLTYGELNRQANEIAGSLIGQFMIQKGDFVGLIMDRSDRSMVCFLAILKAGAVCVPMDPSYPSERVRYMLENSGCTAVIADSADSLSRHGRGDGKAGYQVLDYDRLVQAAASNPMTQGELPGVDSRDPVLVFYTSGSTGTPKGVLLDHKGYVNMAMGLIDAYEITPLDRILQCVSFAFDVSVSEIFSAFLSGAALVVAARARLDHPHAFLEYLNIHKVTVAALTPAYLNALDRDRLNTLRVLITGGEPPEMEDVNYFCSSLAYFNGYGPTEASVYASLHRVDPSEHYSFGVPIGKPLPNTAIHILDRRQQLVPIGIPGEIYISGAGLARNYLGQAEMTAERFVPNPFGEGRLYRTGDMGRRLPDGNILFMGRRDEQIKIRGHRVEPSEIENRLKAYPGVQKVVVIKIGSLHQLAAYLVTEGHHGGRELKAYLSRFLPDYMIPSFFIQLEKLPLTPTGKLDKKALPPPDVTKQETDEPVPPRNPLEENLLAVFQEILDRSSMGVFDNFFDLGGTSIGAVKLVGRVFTELGISVSARQLFLNPTVAAFASALEKKPDTSAAPLGSAPYPRTTHTTIESCSLMDLIGDKTIKPIDAAALEYLPDELLNGNGGREDVLDYWCSNAPVLSGVMDTALGRIGLITLPCFTSDLFREQARLDEKILSALELAGTAGARTVSMTGLLPFATRQGLSVMDHIESNQGLPSLTTSQATVTAVMVMTVEKLLTDAHRSMEREHLGVIGCDAQGRIMLKLMLDVLPHPAAITLCGVYQEEEKLKDLARDLSCDSGFEGPLRLMTARPDVSHEFYDATLIIGAGSATGAIDIRSLGAGTLLAGDPARPCFNPQSAFNRFESQQDVLFTEGDLLSMAAPCQKQIHLTETMAAELTLDQLTGLYPSDPNTITGCVLSGLLSVKYPELPVMTGDLDLEICKKHLLGIKELGFKASELRYGGRVLCESHKERFRERFGTTAGHKSNPPEKRVKAF